MNFFNFDTTYTNLNEIFYVVNNPHPFPHPEYVLFNDGLARELNISFQLKAHPEILTGRTVIEGTAPFSTAYAGHQFGNFTMLGDGRQHILGEHITPQNKRYDIQLKGSGRTYFSRSGDGKATIWADAAGIYHQRSHASLKHTYNKKSCNLFNRRKSFTRKHVAWCGAYKNC